MEMRNIALTVFVLVAALIFSSSPAIAGWQEKVTRNQMNARTYIGQLMNGANPDTIERPYVRYDDKYQAKKANREIREAMDQAEELAREGRHDQIIMPAFKSFMSEERFNELQDSNKGYRGSKKQAN